MSKRKKPSIDADGQVDMLPEAEFDRVYLLEEPDLQKQYTAEHSSSISVKREACLLMLGNNIPVVEIARALHLNKRTVTALAAKYAKTVAQFSDGYAKRLNTMAAEMFALGACKAPEARFAELMMAGGILTDKALAMKMAVSGAMDDQKTIEATEENESLRKAREFLASKRLTNGDSVSKPIPESSAYEPEKEAISV